MQLKNIISFCSLVPKLFRKASVTHIRCYSVFGIKDLIAQEKPDFTVELAKSHQHGQALEMIKRYYLPEHVLPDFTVDLAKSHQHGQALEMIKRYYLPEHVLVRARGMDLGDDCAVDEYLMSLFKQGNTMFAKSEDGKLAGICVGFASSPADVKNLRTFAFYRQDPNTKDFLYFMAKLQETPNLWETFKQQKIYEIKMLAVVPEFRRQGLATTLVEMSQAHAHDLGYHVVRMNCINQYDYKVAERCMFNCVVKFPLHRLRDSSAAFCPRSSPHNCCVRVYVAARPVPDAPDLKAVRERHREMDNLIE